MRKCSAVLLALALTASAGALEAQESDLPSGRPALAVSLEIDTTKLKTTESGLGILDVKVGDGALAEPGKQVTVHYTLYKPDGEKTESSHDGGEPFQFELGAGSVIGGWEEGVQGMKVGGRRKLVVPPELAYNNGYLVFDIEVLGVE